MTVKRRIVKEPEERRSELIACAQRLFFTRGYESTSVRDIVNEIGVAKGLFYYYFDSKQAILEALVDSMVSQSVNLVQGIVGDDTLGTLQKWERVQAVVGTWKLERKAELLKLLRMMQMDENILLRHKVQEQSALMLAPVYAELIVQGVDEGIFETSYAAESAEIIIGIMLSIRDPIFSILLHPGEYEDPAALASRKLAAVQSAIERVLAAPAGSLPLGDSQAIKSWFVGS